MEVLKLRCHKCFVYCGLGTKKFGVQWVKRPKMQFSIGRCHCNSKCYLVPKPWPQ